MVLESTMVWEPTYRDLFGGIHAVVFHAGGGVHVGGGVHAGGLYTGGFHGGGIHGGGIHGGGIHGGGIHAGGIHTGGIHAGGIHAGGIHAGGIHTGGGITLRDDGSQRASFRTDGSPAGSSSTHRAKLLSSARSRSVAVWGRRHKRWCEGWRDGGRDVEGGKRREAEGSRGLKGVEGRVKGVVEGWRERMDGGARVGGVRVTCGGLWSRHGGLKRAWGGVGLGCCCGRQWDGWGRAWDG